MVEPYMENPAQLNTNSIKEKNNKNTDLSSNHHSIAETSNDKIDRYDYYKEIINKNIDYEYLIKRQDSKMVDEIVDIMFDYIAIHRINTRIAGADYPHQVVKDRLLKLTSAHVDYVIDCINENTTKIHNIKAYILIALYNAPATIDSYYTTLVNHDMATY
jgi:hypothetical protein